MDSAPVKTRAALAAGIVAGVWVLHELRGLWARRRLGRGTPAVARDLTELIGDTPIVRLNALSNLTQCEIWAKLELANPGGSAKDRVALAIVEAAERAGRLRRGAHDAHGRADCVFEGTSGSTGISIALICRARGYEAHIVVPDDTSQDKLALLRMLGAHVHLVRPASIADTGHYVNTARRLASEVNAAPDGQQAIFADQFENEANWEAHFRATGPELWAQLPQIDCFVSGAGTGGTMAGVSRFLKAHKQVRTVLADVPGSGLYNRVHFGVMYSPKEREGTRRRHQVDTVVEGIGLNRVTANLRQAEVDDAEAVADVDTRFMATHLVEQEGLFVGSSSAVAAVAAFRQARKLGPGHTIGLIFCDSGARHVSKFWALPVDRACPVALEIEQAARDRSVIVHK